MPFFGSIIHRLESVDSTNNYANQLIEHNLADNGSVIVADFQSKGRGQRGKNWLADAGMNLTCTLIYFPANLSADRLYLLNCWISYLLVKLLKKFGIDAKVKWPNDLYVGTTKIAGLLIEVVVQGILVKSCTIGVGLNINQTGFEGLNATSMSLETGTDFSIQEVLQDLCRFLNEEPLEFYNDTVWRARYMEVMFGRYEQHLFKLDQDYIHGFIQGISDEGALEILVDGQLKKYVQGQINLVIPFES